MNKKTAYMLGSMGFLVLMFGITSRVSAATLSLTPTSSTVTAGQTVNVDIILDTTGAAVDGVDVYSLHYDPTLLQIQDANSSMAGVQITAGSLFPITIANSVNPTTGTIQFSQVTSGGTSYNGSGKLASITFKGLYNGTSYMRFDFTVGSTVDTNVAGNGIDKLTNVTNASIQVTGGTANPNPNVPSGAAHPNGTLILDGSTVWLIKDNTRVGFRNPEEYQSFGYNFGQVVPATSGDLALSVSSSVLKAMEGTLVLDKADNRTVYMVGTGATKRGFSSDTVFKALGYNFNNLAKINLSDYPAGSVISDSSLAHPDGALVLQGSTIWWIRGNTKQGFESMAVFNTYGFSLARVVPANNADISLTTGALVKFRDGTLVSESGNYYIISDGKKLMFASTTDLSNRGYKAGNAIAGSLGSYDSAGNIN